MLFQIIATFEELEQVIIEKNLNVKNEEKFIHDILDELDDEEIKQLIKFSICHIAKNKYEPLKWLYDRNGKYYFNYEINNDDDTKKWNELKVNYLKNIVTL
jgi:hypothetical protein